MLKNIFGKLALTLVILGWALINIFPMTDRPFSDYIKSRATANQEGFSNLMDRAGDAVEEGSEASLYLSLKHLANHENIDLSTYFPGINLTDVKNLEKRNDILLKYLLQESKGKIKLGLDLKGGVAFTLKIDEASLMDKGEYQKKQQLNKAIDIIDRRVNGLGVAEPVIRARGTESIEVLLPGLSTQNNPDVLANLQKPAKLTFHRVYREIYPTDGKRHEAPIGYQRMVLESEDSRTGKILETELYVKRIPEMGGSMIKEAYAVTNQYGAPQVSLSFTNTGTVKFAEITGAIADENNKKPYVSLPEDHPAKYGRLAIVLDGKLYSAPRVMEKIPSGSAQITGQFTQREVMELVNVLNNPLEFELKLEEMYEVGPTLAEDARKSSINAAILGAGLVILFMIGYYLSMGLVAVITVIANIIIVVGVLASLKSTLTLPGVAALVLTIGMAVDANILIFERIREELNAGKKIKDALAAGFDKAFSTILDANITTLLTAGILIWLGTGPVKGFGVTLSIGIFSTLFTCLILSRALLELLVKAGFIKQMFKIKALKEPKYHFLEYKKPAFICSWLIVLAGLIGVAVNYNHIYGIDFIGGDEVTLSFTEKLSMQDIYDTAENSGIGEVIPVYQNLIGSEDNQEVLKIQTPEGLGIKFVGILKVAYPDADLELIGENSIGASVSDSIKTNALLAIGVALLGILLYIAFRFEWGYGIGAVVSTVHDVLMTVGIFVLLGGQFTAPMVAAILMIVGYSINDTIVVFDRIREELKYNPTHSLKRVVNFAINKTLSRTLLTSLTTLLSALALYIFGAGVINDFALVFIIGIITGTFSSIFIASPVFYWWHKGDRKHVEVGELKPKYEWESGS